MENSQANLNHKRQHDENESGAQCKLPRLGTCDDEQLDRTTKIIDCDDICLVKMFNHLNLIDLLKLADANKLLVPAARYVYKNKFGTKTVRISGCDDLRPNTRANARTGRVSKSTAPRERFPGSINIRHLKWSLQFLRCFGPSITHLSIYYNKSKSPRYQFVHQYMNQYCAESLIEISFRDLSNIKIQNFNERPFANVTTVNIFDSHLGKQLPSMVEWFPNLRSLKLSKIRLNHRFVNANFRHLENLEICENDCNGFTINDIGTFLSLNHQLRSINITSLTYPQQFSIARLLDIIRDNVLIEKLIVRIVSESMFSEIKPAEIDRILNEHPALVELDLLFSQFKADDVIVLHRQLKSLKKLNFTMFPSEYEKLQPNLDNGWVSHSHMNFVTVRRERQN